VIGEVEGEILEYRKPCEPEKEKLRRGMIASVRSAKLLVLIFWILVPLGILILEFTNPLVGQIAFGLSLAKLGIECVKFFGNPDKWIPGHAAKSAKQRKMEHYYYHCEKNPKGFASLTAENFERDEAQPRVAPDGRPVQS